MSTKNNAPRKPTKKKGFSIEDYKKSKNLITEKAKPLEWYKCSDALHEATGLYGFPKGYVSLTRGLSNTGKSTSLSEAIVDAQKQGDLVIMIDTETNLGRDRLSLMGFDWDSDDYIMIDSDFLLNEFGKLRDPKRIEASIEDMADCVNFFLNEQEIGNLPRDILFAVDSIGTLNCNASIAAKDKGSSDNNMWNAGAYEHAFKSIINNRIPSTRKTSKPYTATFVGVQKVWIDNMGNGVMKNKGGEAFYFAARLMYQFGGIKSNGAKAVKFTSKKKEVQIGVETRVSVVKNHLDGELGGISMDGRVVSTPHGFISPESINDYKRDHILYYRERLGDNTLEAKDISVQKLTVDEDNEDNFTIEDITENIRINNETVNTDSGEVIDD